MSKDRVKAYRLRQKQLGRVKRELYLTDAEWAEVKIFIKELRKEIMSKVIELGKGKKFVKEGELMERLTKLIDEYAGELSLVAVLGILELKKTTMIDD